MIKQLLFIAVCASPLLGYAESPPSSGVDLKEWDLVWQDEFDYKSDAKLDKRWESQNSPSGHILCSRWRENAVLTGETLRLVNKKEQRGGQEWTSGSIWTREKFMYGYYECRYRYAAVNATNNSFWLMTQGADPKEGKRFEIDINEGHFPNEVNTNIHNWSDITTNADGKKVHPSASRSFSFGSEPNVKADLEIPVTAKKIRVSSKSETNVIIRELRAYGVNDAGYPEVLSDTADKDVEGLVNYVRGAGVKITSSGCYNDSPANSAEASADGSLGSGWNSQVAGDKWLEVEFPEAVTLGCVQFSNGWRDNHGNWQKPMSDYRLEYHNGKEWVEMLSLDVNESFNFAEEYQVCALEWNERELIFYHNGKEIRREPNEFCYSESPIWLSLAIIKWDGPVTDALDGTYMEVDYVRVYKPKK